MTWNEKVPVRTKSKGSAKLILNIFVFAGI